MCVCSGKCCADHRRSVGGRSISGNPNGTHRRFRPVVRTPRRQSTGTGWRAHRGPKSTPIQGAGFAGLGTPNGSKIGVNTNHPAEENHKDPARCRGHAIVIDARRANSRFAPDAAFASSGACSGAAERHSRWVTGRLRQSTVRPTTPATPQTSRPGPWPAVVVRPTPRRGSGQPRVSVACGVRRPTGSRHSTFPSAFHWESGHRGAMKGRQ